MSDPGAVVIRPMTPGRWDDLVELFGTRGDPSWCWCQFFLTTGQSYEQSAPRNRAALRAQVRSATTPVGLVAYAAGPAPAASRGGRGTGGPTGGPTGDRTPAQGPDGTPVGWVQLGPRPSFPRITGSRSLAAVMAESGDDPADASVWAVTCFVVKVGWRRRGIAGALLGGAVDLAREHGARAVVGHPVDVAARAGRVSGSELYHGAASTFAAAGFMVVGRTGATRPVMRLELPPA